MSYTTHNNKVISFYRSFIQSVLIFLLNLTAQEDAAILYEQVLAKTRKQIKNYANITEYKETSRFKT